MLHVCVYELYQVDPVRIESIEAFGTAEQLGDKLLKIETAKDGVFNVQLLTVEEKKIPVISSHNSQTTHPSAPEYSTPIVNGYGVEYSVKSTRGEKHYHTLSTIHNKELYVLTAQCNENTHQSAQQSINNILQSVAVLK